MASRKGMFTLGGKEYKNQSLRCQFQRDAIRATGKQTFHVKCFETDRPRLCSFEENPIVTVMDAFLNGKLRNLANAWE